MKYEHVGKIDLIEQILSLEDRIKGLRNANESLLAQLRVRDLELIKLRRELQERAAEAIWRESDTKRNQERFQSLVTNIPGTVYRCCNDAYWTMEYLSDKIEELSGYPASDFINNAVRSYASIVHPADVIKVVDAIREGVERNIPYVIEYRIRHKDGSIRTVFERGIGVHAADGTLLWLDGIILDLSGVDFRFNNPTETNV